MPHAPPLVVALALSLCAAPARADVGETDLQSAVTTVRQSLSGGSGTTWWELGGRVAYDGVRRGHDNVRGDSGQLDAAVVALRAGRGPWHGLVEVDAEGSDTPSNLREAWVGYAFGPRLVVRAGQVVQAMNTELSTPAIDRGVPGVGFASHLTGRTAPGVAVESEWNCGAIRYEVSATSGHGFGVEGAPRAADRIVGRVVLRPLQNVLPAGTPVEIGNGLWVGLAASRDDDLDGPVRIETPLEATVFRSHDLDGDGATAWLWEIGWAWDRWRVSLERTEGELEDVVARRRGPQDFDQLTAWSVHAAISLTATRYGIDHGRWTREPAESLPNGDWEIAARYSNADIDRDLIDARLAPLGRASQETRTFSAALSWRPVEEVRLSLAFVQTIADEPLAAFDGERRDHSVLIRVEVEF